MALVRKAGEDADARRAIDRSRQDQDQWRAYAESEPPGACGRRRDGTCAGAGRLFVVRVAGEAERRGPATVARALYEDLTPVAPRSASERRSRPARVPPSATAGGSTPSRPTMLAAPRFRGPGLGPAPLAMACLVLVRDWDRQGPSPAQVSGAKAAGKGPKPLCPKPSGIDDVRRH